MDGLNILGGLISEARKSASGKAFREYCGVELMVHFRHGVFFLFHIEKNGNRGNELNTSEAVKFLNDAYLSFTETWQVGLSPRARQVLQRYGVFTLDELGRQLRDYDENAWRARQNCGLRAYGEIKEHYKDFAGVEA